MSLSDEEGGASPVYDYSGGGSAGDDTTTEREALKGAVMQSSSADALSPSALSPRLTPTIHAARDTASPASAIQSPAAASAAQSARQAQPRIHLPAEHYWSGLCGSELEEQLADRVQAAQPLAGFHERQEERWQQQAQGWHINYSV